MIKTRLMKLLKGSEKYIIQNILWQWIALLFQIAAIFAAGTFLQSLMDGTLNQGIWTRTAVIAVLSLLVRFGCEKMAAIASGNNRIFRCLHLNQKICLKITEILFPISCKNIRNTHILPLCNQLIHLNHMHGKYIF